jgi:hypothetical protein
MKYKAGNGAIQDSTSNMKVYEAISFIWGRWKAALLLVSRRLTTTSRLDDYLHWHAPSVAKRRLIRSYERILSQVS